MHAVFEHAADARLRAGPHDVFDVVHEPRGRVQARRRVEAADQQARHQH